MSSSIAKRRVAVTERDCDLFAALYRSPMTAENIFQLSETFAEPFPTVRRVQARLGQLVAAGLLQAWPFRCATSGQGSAPNYYKLTRESYRFVFGHDAILPTKRFLDEVSMSLQSHKLALADFTVHTLRAIHRHRIPTVYFHPENTHRIEVGESTLFPDQAFGLQPSPPAINNYCVELDNSTEPVRSSVRLDSWERRLRLYYREIADTGQRFKLLIVNTKNGTRLPHLLDLARELNPDPSYSMVAGVVLGDYLSEADPLLSACFRDQNNQRVPLLRVFAATAPAVLSSAPDRQATALMV